jgi:hypothetical protein
MSADFETARAIASSLPGVEESTSYGTPAFRVGKKLFARFHQDGESLVLRVGLDEREALMRSDPKAFFITDHYRSEPYVLVRLRSVSKRKLKEVLRYAWRLRAPRKLLEAFEAANDRA